ncbi:MAG TPA: RluA family pseudouridine synthase [Sphingorhabdus lacus]|nr:RluA family pseudouridine synthase [Sphingorhabdus lacus]HPV69312.1 RluA family pseudouridine synthase [Sphingorhabdus lacus]
MSKNDEKGIRQFVVESDDDGIRLDRWFKRHLPDASFNIVSRWARTGQLRVDGKRATPGDRLLAGQAIRVPPADTSAAASARPVRKRRELTEDEMEFALSMVIHKDDAALVINKPAGLATQGGTKTENHVDGLLDALFFEMDNRPKLVHRLDKDTSGALLLARTSRSAGHFSKAFSSRTARKVYWALVVGVPDIADGFIDLPIGKQPGSGGEKMHVDEQNGQSARTRYRIVERAGNTCAWVELQPYTGRTHQLRVHMAAIGHPIVGDGKYGGKDAFLTGTISRKMHLHARRLRIDHPQGHQIDVRADLPPHMQDSFADLGFDIELGDALVLDAPKYSETVEGKKRIAANIAKSARKERKGERRSRGTVTDKPKDKKRSQLATGKKIAAKKPVIKKSVVKKPVLKK